MEHDGEVEEGQQDPHEGKLVVVVADAAPTEEATTEKAEKVSLSDEEPNEEEKPSSLSNDATTIEWKVSFTTNNYEKSKEDDEVAGDATTAAVPPTSLDKSVEVSQEIERKENKSIRLQDGTLLFQPSSPPGVALSSAPLKENASSQGSVKSASRSPPVADAGASTMKDDTSHDSRKSEPPPSAATVEAASNCGTDSKNGSETNQDDILMTCVVKDEAFRELGDASSSSSGKKEEDDDAPEPPGNQSEKDADEVENKEKDDNMDVDVDNDDKEADVANVLLGLMGR